MASAHMMVDLRPIFAPMLRAHPQARLNLATACCSRCCPMCASVRGRLRPPRRSLAPPLLVTVGPVIPSRSSASRAGRLDRHAGHHPCPRRLGARRSSAGCRPRAPARRNAAGPGDAVYITGGTLGSWARCSLRRSPIGSFTDARCCAARPARGRFLLSNVRLPGAPSPHCGLARCAATQSRLAALFDCRAATLTSAAFATFLPVMLTRRG